MIERQAASKLLQLARHFRAVAILGPRHSGKTTLAKTCFPDKPYASLETPTLRQFALEDPIQSDWLKGIKFWQKLTGQTGGVVLHGGLENQLRSEDIQIYSWRKVADY